MESLCNMARRGVEMEKKMENLAKMVEQQGEAPNVSGLPSASTGR